jgi:hypothetical protein
VVVRCELGAPEGRRAPSGRIRFCRVRVGRCMEICSSRESFGAMSCCYVCYAVKSVMVHVGNGVKRPCR